MKRGRISLGVVGAALSAALFAAILPQARSAGAILVANEDPAALAKLRVGQALNKDTGMLAESIEVALSDGDARSAADAVAAP